MSGSVIKSHLLRQPFVPFRLHLSDGSFYDVTFPVTVAVDGDITIVRLLKPIGSPNWDQPDILDNAHITRLVPLTQ